jgi:hypothetical protein
VPPAPLLRSLFSAVSVTLRCFPKDITSLCDQGVEEEGEAGEGEVVEEEGLLEVVAEGEARGEDEAEANRISTTRETPLPGFL